MASKGGGPAFQIAAGLTPVNPFVDSFKTVTTCRDADNDIVMSQRPSKFLNGIFPNPTCGSGSQRTVVLDYVILKALERVWGS